MLNCKFRVTYVDVTSNRRVSFAQSVGIVDTPYGISYLALAKYMRIDTSL